MQEVNPVRKQEGARPNKKPAAVIVACDMVTPFGVGADACWDGIMSGNTAVSRVNRFDTKAFQSDNAATVDALQYFGEDSLVMQMFKILFRHTPVPIPEDARLLLGTIKGEIDLLEKHYLHGTGEESDCNLGNLLGKVIALTGVRDKGTIISAACASSTAALARAAAMIQGGHCDCVLVVACDSVTEFLFSGFSALMALDKIAARPFDRNRSGLSVGEAAAFALVMSEERARLEKRRPVGRIIGWGLSDDADHMTRPSSDSMGRALAITKALKIGGIDRGSIGLISAHGTGTPQNDSAEIRAFNFIFDNKIPVYSVKGAIGHTMGAAGLVEMIVALRALREQTVPPTVNLEDCEEEARGWVSSASQRIGKDRMALITNAGFGGINAALIVS